MIGSATMAATRSWNCSPRSWRKTMRASDVIGRLGGEEFVAMVPGTLAEAAVAAERVRSAFAAARSCREGQRIPATVSVGVACGCPLAAVETLITRADAALYRAKANGRNRVEMRPGGRSRRSGSAGQQGLAATVRQAPAAWVPGIGRRADPKEEGAADGAL